MIFNIYKRGQGKYTRLCTGFGLGLIVALGCLRLFSKLQASDFGIGRDVELIIETMVPAALFVLLGLLIYWLVNKPSVANFMIDAEGEMKKVSWSSRQEIVTSTFIVIFVVVFMALLLGFFDVAFQMIFDKILR